VPESTLANLAGWCFEVLPRTTPNNERGALSGKIDKAGKAFLAHSCHLSNALYLGGHSSDVSACAARFYNAIRKAQTGLAVLLKMQKEGLAPDAKL